MFISNSSNLGLGVAQNLGIVKSIELGATHILLLDDDSTVEKQCVENMFSELIALEKSNLVGAIGPIYYNEATGEQYPITKYKGPFIDRILPQDKPVEASFLISSGCLIPVIVIKEVVLMNEDFFIDYIDVEWSFRAASKGYKLFATPKARMNHVIGEQRASVFGRKVSIHSPLRKYYLFRNSIFMIRCPYISFGYKLREVVFNFIRFFVYLFYCDQKMEYIKYTFRGYYDGFLGVSGKCPYQK